jgi:glycosyltransferase involved in cell wall biosynthesis
VIVVNDTGESLPGSDWQRSERVQVIDTNRRERSVARNVGAAIADGEYLHFLDDDDWLLPGALQNLWDLSKDQPEAAWLYGGSQLVDRGGESQIQLHHNLNGNCFVQVMAGEWIPLQSSLIKSQVFFDLGGFNPLIPGIEDVDLSRRIALHGNIAETPATIGCISMGAENSLTDHERAIEYGRWARELVLDESSAFSRIRSSAKSSYWYGRVLRVYLTSVIWNINHSRPLKATSRLFYAFAGSMLAGLHVYTRDFWGSVFKRYESATFMRGFQESNPTVELQK